MKFRRAVVALTLLFGISANRAEAAQFKTIDLPDGGGVGLLIEGVIAAGDQAAFHALAETMTNATVVTTGPGGSVGPALAIGDEVRARGWATLVPANAKCASSCSLIWLAGTRHMLALDAQIGFHAISITQPDGQHRESHEFDHILRRWLTNLGYAMDATATIVNTNAAAIRWFDATELNANGIPTDPFP